VWTAASAAAIGGLTICATLPPNLLISRTNVLLMQASGASGTRKTV